MRISEKAWAKMKVEKEKLGKEERLRKEEERTIMKAEKEQNRKDTFKERLRKEEAQFYKDIFNKPKDYEPNPQLRRWLGNVEKGRRAEKIIEEMFTEACWEMFEFGHEKLFPSVKINSLKNRDELDAIRCMPDFFAYDKYKKKAFFIEVKYRKNGDLSPEEISRYFRHWNPVIVVLASIKEPWFTVYEKGRYQKLPLERRKALSITNELIEKYATKLMEVKKFEELKPFG